MSHYYYYQLITYNNYLCYLAPANNRMCMRYRTKNNINNKIIIIIGQNQRFQYSHCYLHSDSIAVMIYSK